MAVATTSQRVLANENTQQNPHSEMLNYNEGNTQLSTPQHQMPSASATKTGATRQLYNGFEESPNQPDPEAWKSAPAGTAAVRHLTLHDKDQKHRLQGALSQPGYCVDELCACFKHQCVPGKKPVPFEGQTMYRTDYNHKPLTTLTAKEKQASLYGPDGVPYGVHPATWKDYVAKHGVPTGDTLPSCLFYTPAPDRRDFATEHRAQFVARTIETSERMAEGIKYGPDGVPVGVDPKVWASYIEKHGVSSKSELPASLFYKTTPETRDFSTEHRVEYTAKEVPHPSGISAQLDQAPYGVDPQRWEAYVKEHGVPSPSIPVSLFYRPTPDNRDFVTHYRKDYTPYTVSVCPVTRLPPYATPKWPQEHTFWDPVAKAWY